MAKQLDYIMCVKCTHTQNIHALGAEECLAFKCSCPVFVPMN